MFIFLVYAIAGLVLSLSSQHLEGTERAPIIWFLVIFPFVVLIIFYKLVTKHHTKLYAPLDFPDPEGFFRALTPAEQKERLNIEFEEIESTVANKEDIGVLKVNEHGNGIEDKQFLKNDWILAEELAIRELEDDFETHIQRQVAIDNEHAVDGVFVDEGLINIIEVKFTDPNNFSSIARQAFNTFIKILKTAKPRPHSFILVMVVTKYPEETFSNEIKSIEKEIASLAFKIDLRVYYLSELKEKYGLVTQSIME